MATTKTWAKMAVVGVGICVGGPMLVNYVQPSQEELFQRFNPDLQRRNLENRDQRQKDFDNYVTKLKEYSKSDKPIWEVMRQVEEEKKQMHNPRSSSAEKKPMPEATSAPSTSPTSSSKADAKQ